MTQERLIKVVADYKDPGLVERISANFRRFWVDIKWMRTDCDDNDICTIFLSLYEKYNMENIDLSITTLSKMVDVDSVEILNDYKINNFDIKYNNSTKYEWGELVE